MTALQGKIALVSGGSRGIGKAICQRLAVDGAFVIVNYAVNEQAARHTVEQITSRGGRAAVLQADIGSLAEISRLYEQADALLQTAFGTNRIDILVNNAGISFSKNIPEVDEASYDRIFSVNLKAPFFMAQQAVSRMPDGGRIVNISSRAAHRAFGGAQLLYSISKHGLTGLTRNLAALLGPRGITVNSLEPGFVLTDLVTSANPLSPEMAAVIQAMTSLGRFGEPEEIADAVAFLASPDARWVTGQCIGADGGLQL